MTRDPHQNDHHQNNPQHHSCLSAGSVPFTTAPNWPDLSPGRFAATISTESSHGCAMALLGLADDTGVRLNHGRPGAAAGPRAFRSALARFGAADPALAEDQHLPRVFDTGDIEPAGDDIGETHRRVTKAAGVLLDAGLVPIGIGGGHDLTFPFVRALAQRVEKKKGTLAGVSFDPHLDVREEVGSGMPFRALLEQCRVARHDIFGFDPMVNSRAHARWFVESRGYIHAMGSGCVEAELTQVLDSHAADTTLYASFDLDVIDAAFAPGVSAMNPAGWSPAQSLLTARLVGSTQRVRCFDIMELCPPHDHLGRTARLAAAIFLAFLQGFSERTPCGH